MFTLCLKQPEIYEIADYRLTHALFCLINFTYWREIPVCARRSNIAFDSKPIDYMGSLMRESRRGGVTFMAIWTRTIHYAVTSR